MKLNQIVGAIAISAAALNGCEDSPYRLSCDQIRAEISSLQGNKHELSGKAGDLRASIDYTRRKTLKAAAFDKGCTK